MAHKYSLYTTAVLLLFLALPQWDLQNLSLVRSKMTTSLDNLSRLIKSFGLYLYTNGVHYSWYG